MREPKDKDKDKTPSPPNDLEADIRRQREFSLAEAVGREAGASLKGASPVPPADQLLLEIDEILAGSLDDGEGSLARTLGEDLAGNPPLLARHFGDPVGALGEYLAGIFEHPTNLETLVRRTDARWGREYDERPHFEKPGQPPHPDDPYTLRSVTRVLRDLRARLSG
jgi:hypothetical protein